MAGPTPSPVDHLLAPRLVLPHGPHHNPSADPHHPYPIWPHLQPPLVRCHGSHIWLALPSSPCPGQDDLAPVHLHSRADHHPPTSAVSAPSPGPAGLTSLLRPASRAAAVEATAAATAAARPRPGSAGNCRKSGAAAGCTSSEGKRPTRPWMVPNLQPGGGGGEVKGLRQTGGSRLGTQGTL